MSARSKAKQCIAMAMDKSATEAERFAHAMRAAAIIHEHELLDSPMESVMDSIDNETVRAAGDIFSRLTDPAFVRSARRVLRGLGGRRSRRGE